MTGSVFSMSSGAPAEFNKRMIELGKRNNVPMTTKLQRAFWNLENKWNIKEDDDLIIEFYKKSDESR